MNWVELILSLFRRPPYREDRAEVYVSPIKPKEALAWGAHVTQEFADRVKSISEGLGIHPDWLMGCMAFETGETFSPSVRNPASSATGLIQFMESTARGMGTTTDALASLSAVDQLEYVRRYFEPRRGQLKNLGDVYMAILWPAGIGRSDEWVLWDSHDSKAAQAYRVNRGLDLNADGLITRAEAVAKVAAKVAKGKLPEHAR